MAKVDYELFLAWAEERFDGDLKISKNEIKANSPFTDDRKYHLWMNPSGGKRKIPHGVYRCWKTDRKGDLISLVSELDGIPYNLAEDMICSQLSLATLSEKVEQLLNGKPKEQVKEENANELTLPENSYLITNLSEENTFKRKSINYLNSRKLNPTGLYVCVSGNYSNRIIIPYYDCYDNLIYFNSRDLGNSELRYKGPPKEVGVGKGDVVFMNKWPKPGERIYLTEGEFDAMSLNACGFYGCAIGGKFLTENQCEFLRPYLITMCFDADKSGKEALMGTGKTLLENGFEKINFVRPPVIYKDWNKFLIESNADEIKNYISKYSKIFNWFVLNDMKLKEI